MMPNRMIGSLLWWALTLNGVWEWLQCTFLYDMSGATLRKGGESLKESRQKISDGKAVQQTAAETLSLFGDLVAGDNGTACP